MRGIFIPLLALLVSTRLRPSGSTHSWSLLHCLSASAPPPCSSFNNLDTLLFCFRRPTSHFLRHPGKRFTLSLLVLLLSGDVETNQGPDASVYPCGFCDQPVTWNCKGIACDGCNVWFHLSCADMASCDYDALGRSSVVWPCPRCDGMNCDSFTFRSFEIDSFNYFAPLQSLSSTDSVSSSNPFTPQKASTPNTFTTSPTRNPGNTNSESSSHARSCSSSVFDLPPNSNTRIMTVNCQSVTQKTQELATVLQYTKPDIVCGTES